MPRKTNKQLEQELAQARVEKEIANHRLQTHLSESVQFGDIVNPFEQFFDGQNLTFPLWPGRWDNRALSSGFWITEGQLDLIRWFSRYLFDTNLTAKGIVLSLQSYVIKCGYEYTCTNKNKTEKYVKEVQAIIDQFIEKNRWFERELDLFVRSRRDGEYFIQLFAQEDGVAEVRIVEPELVRALEPSPEWAFGVFVDVDDREKVNGYWVCRNGVVSDGEYVPAEEMVHQKINTDFAIRRGISDFFCSQEVLRQSQKLLRASVMGESVRQAIAYVTQYEQADYEAVTNMQQQNKDYDTRVQTGLGPSRFVPTEHIEPGTKIDIPKGQNFVDGPKGAGANAVAVLQLAYQALASYWQVPEWLVAGTTGNANYAASLTAEAPFTRNCEKQQKLYSNKFKEIIVKALHMAVEQGVLPEEAMEEINITVTCPPVVVRNAKEETDRHALLAANGIMSKRTWADKEELDVETEQENMRLDNDAPMSNMETTQTKSNTPEARYQQEINRPA